MQALILLIFAILASFVQTNNTDIRDGTKGALSEEPADSVQSVNSNDVQVSLEDVLNFYNTELLSSRWPKFKDEVSRDCRKDMEAYLDGLRKADNWALKSKSILYYFKCRYMSVWYISILMNFQGMKYETLHFLLLVGNMIKLCNFLFMLK